MPKLMIEEDQNRICDEGQSNRYSVLMIPVGKREFSERSDRFLKRWRKFIAKLCRLLQTFGRKKNRFEFLELFLSLDHYFAALISLDCFYKVGEAFEIIYGWQYKWIGPKLPIKVKTQLNRLRRTCGWRLRTVFCGRTSINVEINS